VDDDAHAVRHTMPVWRKKSAKIGELGKKRRGDGEPERRR
jgi:hypothetical protein